MYFQDFFIQALVFLTAAVVAVPIAKKLGLGSVLGYLFAGILIGPFVLKFVSNEVDNVMHFSEFGVILMLFIVGLELQPSHLWKMRHSIFGLGGLQVLLTAFVVFVFAMFFNFGFNKSIAIGLILALSSTAIVLQTMTEKGMLRNVAGRSAFAVLLFQDMAVVPILALIPLLAAKGKPVVDLAGSHNHSFFIDQPAWLKLFLIIAVFTVIFVGGRFVSRYIFRIIAETRLHDIFTAMALLLVIGISLIMSRIGLSPALGSFLAGTLLANSPYRQELETTIDPFKGLLLGIFFISVGANIDFKLLIDNPLQIAGFVFLLILIKFVVLLFLGRLFKLKKGYEFLFAFLLAQSSEFAFVLVSFAEQNRLFDEHTASLILLVAALSMTVSPLLLMLNEKAVSPILSRWQNKLEYDEVEEQDRPIIIAGFGRFGLVVGRMLLANNFNVTIIDSNPRNVEILRKFGFKLYYGDVTRPNVLEKAGIRNARLLILSMAEYDDALVVAKLVRQKYPEVKILARSKDIYHAFEFFKLNVHSVQLELSNSAAELGAKALSFLGLTRYEAYKASRTFKHHDEEILMELFEHWQEDHDRFMEEARRFSEELVETLKAEKNYSIHDTDYAWDLEKK